MRSVTVGWMKVTGHRGASGVERCDSGETDAHPDVSNHVEWRSPGLIITTCRSRCPAGDWCPPHEDLRYGVALPLQGAWRRRATGSEQFVAPSMGFFRRAGEVTEVAHFENDVHTGTVIDVDPELATPVLAEIALASGPFVVSPHMDLTHRLLLAALRRPMIDHVDVQQRTLSLLAAVVAQKQPGFATHTRRATSATRRRVVNQVCEQLHRTPDTSLVELARSVHYSPFHLSRLFREEVGVTMSTFRARRRVHELLMRVDSGADLSQLAAETGFFDHSHMTRTMVAHVGQTPSELRTRLSCRSV